MTCKLNTGDVTASGWGGRVQADSNVIKNNVKGHYGNAQRTWRRRLADSSSNIPEVKCSSHSEEEGGGGVTTRPSQPSDRGSFSRGCIARRTSSSRGPEAPLDRDPLKHLYSTASVCHVASSTVVICIDVFTLSSVTLPSRRTVTLLKDSQQQLWNKWEIGRPCWLQIHTSPSNP